MTNLHRLALNIATNYFAAEPVAGDRSEFLGGGIQRLGLQQRYQGCYLYKLQFS